MTKADLPESKSDLQSLELRQRAASPLAAELSGLVSDPDELQALIAEPLRAAIRDPLIRPDLSDRVSTGEVSDIDLLRCFVLASLSSDPPLFVEDLSERLLSINRFDPTNYHDRRRALQIFANLSDAAGPSPFARLVRLFRVGPSIAEQSENIPDHLIWNAGRAEQGTIPVAPESRFAALLLPAALTRSSTISELEYSTALNELRDYLFERAFVKKDPDRTGWSDGSSYAEAALVGSFGRATVFRRTLSLRPAFQTRAAICSVLIDRLCTAATNLDFEQLRFLEAAVASRIATLSQAPWSSDRAPAGHLPLSSNGRLRINTLTRISYRGEDSILPLLTDPGEEMRGKTNFSIDPLLRGNSYMTALVASAAGDSRASQAPQLAATCSLISEMIRFDFNLEAAERRRFDIDSERVLANSARLDSSFAAGIIENLINETVRVEHARARGEKNPLPINICAGIEIPRINFDQALTLEV